MHQGASQPALDNLKQATLQRKGSWMLDLSMLHPPPSIYGLNSNFPVVALLTRSFWTSQPGGVSNFRASAHEV